MYPVTTRMSVLVGLLVVACGLVFVCSEAGMASLMAPGALVSVAGMTYVLGRLTFEGQLLRGELLRILRVGGGAASGGEKVLGVLGLYALVSGVVLGLLTALVGGHGGMSQEGIKTSLVYLLYGVLLALGLWVMSLREGRKEGAGAKWDYEGAGRGLLVSTALLVLVVAMVGLMFYEGAVKGAGTTTRADAQEWAIEAEQSTAESLSGNGWEEVSGLWRGADLVWRAGRPGRTESGQDGDEVSWAVSGERAAEVGQGQDRRNAEACELRWEPAGANR